MAVAAALALGGVLLCKNWGKVKEFFTGVFTKIQGLLSGVSNKALAVAAVSAPVTGIPALVIKNRDAVKAFFAGLRVRVTAAFKAAFEGIQSAPAGIKNFFTGIWAGIKDFFASVWDGMVNIVLSIAAWFSGVWASISGAFAAAWNRVRDLFAPVWGSPNGSAR